VQIEDRFPRSILESRGHTFAKVGRKGKVLYGYAALAAVNTAKSSVQAGADPRRCTALLLHSRELVQPRRRRHDQPARREAARRRRSDGRIGVMARILRGEIRWADLNPVRGPEQTGRRRSSF
jgi:hypothetical protein